MPSCTLLHTVTRSMRCMCRAEHHRGPSAGFPSASATVEGAPVAVAVGAAGAGPTAVDADGGGAAVALPPVGGEKGQDDHALAAAAAAPGGTLSSSGLVLREAKSGVDVAVLNPAGPAPLLGAGGPPVAAAAAAAGNGSGAPGSLSRRNSKQQSLLISPRRTTDNGGGVPLASGSMSSEERRKKERGRAGVEYFLATTRNFDHIIQRKTLLLTVNAMLGILLYIVVEQLCWDGADCVDTHATHLIKVIISVSTLILLWSVVASCRAVLCCAAPASFRAVSLALTRRARRQIVDRKRFEVTLRFNEKRKRHHPTQVRFYNFPCSIVRIDLMGGSRPWWLLR